MPIQHIDQPTQTLHHVCAAGCQRAIPFTQLVVATTSDDATQTTTTQSIATPECPQCRTTEIFRVGIADHEVGVGSHPGSLAGTRFADTGGIVHEHTHGYTLDPAIVTLRRQARALERAVIPPHP